MGGQDGTVQYSLSLGSEPVQLSWSHSVWEAGLAGKVHPGTRSSLPQWDGLLVVIQGPQRKAGIEPDPSGIG